MRLAREPGALLRELRPRRSSSAFDRHMGPRREIGLARRSLADLKRVERDVGQRLGVRITVNDVALAAVAGAIRRWLGGEEASSRAMRVKVPVSMHHRDEDADALGNRDSFLFVDLPLAEPDPVRRLQLINAEMRERKEHEDARTLYSIFQGLSHLGPARRAGVRLASSPHEFSLAVSNVPGPREPIYVLGRRVRELHSIAEPADRHALRISVVSLSGEMFFACCADPDALKRLDRLAAEVEHSLDELLTHCGPGNPRSSGSPRGE